MRGDADHQRRRLGWSSERHRRRPERLGPGGQLRTTHGQHAGREGQAAGVPQGDSGDSHSVSNQAAGGAAREGRAPAADQRRAASGEEQPAFEGGGESGLGVGLDGLGVFCFFLFSKREKHPSCSVCCYDLPSYVMRGYRLVMGITSQSESAILGPKSLWDHNHRGLRSR